MRQLLKLYGGGFSPMQYAPALWLDASDQSTMYQERTGASATTLVTSDADPVGTWRDKSGNARHATAASDSVRPSYKVGITNGKSVVRYDGTDDTLSIASSNATFNFLHQSPSTVFIVASVGSSSDPNALIVFIENNGTASANTGIAIWYDDRASSRNNAIVCLLTNSSGGVPNSPVSTVNQDYFTPQTVGILSFSIDPANATAASRYTVRLNGGNALSSNSNTATPSANNATFNFTVGSGAGRIDYHELLIYPSALSTSQRQQVERYLSNKWGITLS